MVIPFIESRIKGLKKPDHLTVEHVKDQVDRIRDACSVIEKDPCERKSELYRLITFLDLTSLNEDDTKETIGELCSRACNPLNRDHQTYNVRTAAVCVHQARSLDALDILKTQKFSNVNVAVVAGDFPSAQLPFDQRLADVRAASITNVDEIDIVIDRKLVRKGKWESLFKEIKDMRKLCGPKCVKTILSTGELDDLDQIYKAAMVAMSAGTDFIKSCTGKGTDVVNLEHGVIMCEAIKEFQRLTGRQVGIKPAGGIKTAQQAKEWLVLIKTSLGKEWLRKKYFRIGASSLLDDLLAQINRDD